MHRDAGLESQRGGQCHMHTSHWIQRPQALASRKNNQHASRVNGGLGLSCNADNPSTSAGPRQWQPHPF
jgi:hypothetical protein